MFTKIKLSFVLALLTFFVSINSIAYAGDFAIKEVQVKSSKVLEVSFTNDLAEKSEELSEFMITENQDNSLEVKVDSLESVSTNSLRINLAGELKSNTKYDLTVIFVADSEGTVIENGASGIATFETPDFSLQSNEEELGNRFNEEEVSNQSNEEVMTDEEVMTEDLNSASEGVSTEENKTEETVTVSEGNDEEEATKTSAEEVATEENMTEVKTGTQEIFLIFLALLLAFLFLSVRKKA